MRAKVVTALASASSLLAGIAVPIAFPEIEPWVGYSLLIAAAVLFAFSIGLWWPSRSHSRDISSQTSGGPNSPNIGQARDIHFNYGPPAPEPKPEPKSPWDDPNFKLSDPSTWSATQGGLLPDMELKEVCDRLYDSLGGPVQLIKEFEERVDLEIKDNVRLRNLHTWGRRGIKEGLDEVWRDAWLKGDFSHKAGQLSYRHPDNQLHPIKWIDLRFNRSEVDNWLPPKSFWERRPDLGPNGWMAG